MHRYDLTSRHTLAAPLPRCLSHAWPYIGVTSCSFESKSPPKPPSSPLSPKAAICRCPSPQPVISNLFGRYANNRFARTQYRTLIISSHVVSDFPLDRRPDSAHSSSSSSLPPSLCYSLQTRSPINTTKTPSPVITYKHPLVDTFQHLVEMEAEVPTSPMSTKPEKSWSPYSDSPVREKSPVFSSPQSEPPASPPVVPYGQAIKYDSVPAPLQIRIPTCTPPSLYRSSTLPPNHPWNMYAADRSRARSTSTSTQLPSSSTEHSCLIGY